MSARASLLEVDGERSPATCPLCGSGARVVFTAQDLNRAIDDEGFAYARCNSCACWFLISPPKDLARFYPHEYYDLPTAETLDELARAQRFYIQLLLDRVAPGRLVEVGPGEGVFAHAARNAGFEVSAIEMDSRSCEHLRSVVGVEAINSSVPEETLRELPPSRAVVMWQVLEHLRNPWEVIEQAAANLESGGVLAISTPNPGALQFKLLGRRWAHLDAPRHLFLIAPKALARRCAQLDLALIYTSTSDPAGLHWNRFGWEYALRRAPRSNPTGRGSSAVAMAITRLMRPIESRGANGCAYTSIFVKSQAR